MCRSSISSVDAGKVVAETNQVVLIRRGESIEDILFESIDPKKSVRMERRVVGEALQGRDRSLDHAGSRESTCLVGQPSF